MVRWDDMRVLLALHRGGSSKRASEVLAVDETTIHRRLDALAEALGAPLVLRARGKLVLTPLAEEIVEEAVLMERCVDRASGQADRALREASGKVRVTAPQFIATHVLGPALPSLLERYQRLAVELVGTDVLLDPTRAETDVAIRIDRPKGDGLLIRRIGRVEFAWYASARLSPDELPKRALHYQTRRYKEDERARVPRLELPAVECNGEAVLREAAAAGAGWALLPSTTGARDPRLVRKDDGGHRDVWLVVHKDQRADPRIVAVRAWVLEAIATIELSPKDEAPPPRPAREGQARRAKVAKERRATRRA